MKTIYNIAFMTDRRAGFAPTAHGEAGGGKSGSISANSAK
jgi:hypothetical protein